MMYPIFETLTSIDPNIPFGQKVSHMIVIANGILSFLVVIPAIKPAIRNVRERITIVKTVINVKENGGPTLPTLREDQIVVLGLFVMIGITAMTLVTPIQIFVLMELH